MMRNLIALALLATLGGCLDALDSVDGALGEPFGWRYSYEIRTGCMGDDLWRHERGHVCTTDADEWGKKLIDQWQAFGGDNCAEPDTVNTRADWERDGNCIPL